VYWREDEVFTVSAGVAHTLSARRGVTSEELAPEFALRQAHGLIDLRLFETGRNYDLTFGEHWDPASEDSSTSDQAIRQIILEVAERMLRSEASNNEIPFLDVEGLAQVLEVDLQRLREQLVLMEAEGLLAPRTTSFGHGLREGAFRITAAGLGVLESVGGSHGSESAFRAIVFTDIVGSTEVLSRLGDEAGRTAIREVEAAIKARCTNHAGRIVKGLGDGSMLSFASARSALEFALDTQGAISGSQFDVRMGIAAGEPIAEDADLYGVVVAQASRITNLGGGGDVLVSDGVRQLLLGKEFSFEFHGEHDLRGFDEPVKVWKARLRSS
jgi:class 3 adenylate cyclase